jgi:hypothetical protein
MNVSQYLFMMFFIVPISDSFVFKVIMVNSVSAYKIIASLDKK